MSITLLTDSLDKSLFDILICNIRDCSVKSFDTVSDYLAELANDPELAILPLQMVADHLGLTRAAVDRMVRIGQLEEIRIEKTRFVSAESLYKRQQEHRHKVAKVRVFLEDCARERRIVTYEPVMEKIGLSPSIPADRTAIGKILGDILKKSWRKDRILLTAIVHRKTTGKTRPGPGFAAVLEEIEDFPEYEDEDAMVTEAIQKVWDHYAQR